jgi:type IV pilus assembly protein PilP
MSAARILRKRAVRRLWAVGLALAFGCSSSPPPAKKTAPAEAQSNAKSDKSAKNRRKGQPEVAAPVDTAPPPPKREFHDENFVETEQSRDPFRGFTELFSAQQASRVQVQRKVLMEEYSVDELKLVGIVSRINPAKAMLVDPRGQGHVVQRGDFVGKAERVQVGSAEAEFELNWRIDRIRDADLVLVREDPSNPDVPSATRVVALRPEDAPAQ